MELTQGQNVKIKKHLLSQHENVNMSSLQLLNAILMSQKTAVAGGLCRKIMGIGIQFMCV